jgi:hypothetical protein
VISARAPIAYGMIEPGICRTKTTPARARRLPLCAVRKSRLDAVFAGIAHELRRRTETHGLCCAVTDLEDVAACESFVPNRDIGGYESPPSRGRQSRVWQTQSS